MSGCEGCARAKASQQRTNKVKLKEKAAPKAMIEYGENHSKNVYWMSFAVTGRVIETRDIRDWVDIFLNC